MKKLIPIICLLFIIGKITAQDSALVFYYPLNEIYTNYVPDESGNENRGIAYNTLPAKDRFGNLDQALYFFGDSFINFEADAFNFNEYSYVLWAKVIEQPLFGTAQFLFDIGSDYGVDQYIAYTNGYSLYDLYGYLGQGYNTNSNSFWISQGNLIYDEDWHFIVYTRSANYIKLFIDGEVIDSLNTQESTPIYGDDIKGYIGCRNDYSQFFKGYIDDIQLYNYAIDQDQVTELFGYFITDVEKLEKENISVYNKSTSKKIKISIKFCIEDNLYFIYNTIGERVLNINNTSKIDVSSLTNGMYILKMEDNKNHTQLTTKFIIN